MLLKEIVKIHGKKIKTMMTGISGINTNISGIENNIGNLSSLTTTEKSNLVGAVNETHDVPLDIQELYKPLIAPYSVSLSGFVEGSYLLYGEFYDELRVFVKVSKTTAMDGGTPIGVLPSGYRPAETQELNAYDEDGNIIADAIVYITPASGNVTVFGDVDPNVIVMAAYKSS